LVSTLSRFLLQQQTRWYRRGIDRAHGLRRHLAYYVARHGFEIGDYSAGYPTVRLYDRSKLKVGKYSSIAFGATFIMGGLHRTDTVTTSLMEIPHGYAPAGPDIVVGSDVWIATEAVIVSGATIGDGAVVGAGAVVIEDVPPYGVVFGNPARLIRKRFADDIVAELLALRWWDFPSEEIEARRSLLLGNDVARAIDAFRKLKGLPPWKANPAKAAPALATNGRATAVPAPKSEADICRGCIERLAELLKVPASAIDPTARISRLGMDSKTAITFVFDLEEWLELQLESEIIYEHRTVQALAAYLAERCAGESAVRRVS
jgi:acetyltransferase-like isoleucine patch superfamily enzyme/acyl carrier protein